MHINKVSDRIKSRAKDSHSLKCRVPLYTELSLSKILSSSSQPPITRISVDDKTATAAQYCRKGASQMLTHELVEEEYASTFLVLQWIVAVDGTCCSCMQVI